MFRTTLIASAVAVLSGCAVNHPVSIDAANRPIIANGVNGQIAVSRNGFPITDATQGSVGFAETLAVAVPNKPVARRSTHAWHGSRLVDVQDDEVLPPVFADIVNFNFDDRATGDRVGIAVIAERISRVSGVVVRVKSDVYGSFGQTAGFTPPPVTFPGLPQLMPLPVPPPSSGAAAGAVRPPLPATLPMPMQGAPVAYNQPITDASRLEMKWNGSIKGFLDHVTSRLGVSWSYRDGVVVIERYVTETFEMTGFGGTQDYKMSLSGGNTGSGGAGGQTGSATSTLDLAEAGKLAVLQALTDAIKSMVVPTGGSVVFNDGTGRFFVTATKDVMSRVRAAIKAEDLSMQRQAMIQFDVYSVISSDNDEAGVDWQVLFKNLSNVWGARIGSPSSLVSALAGNLGINILSGVPGNSASARFGDSKLMLNLLKQYGGSTKFRPISLVALNRQWARKTNLSTTGYVSETTPSTSSSAGSGAPGLKTSSITTGDKVMVQPAIMDNGTIMLKFGVSLSDLLSLLDVTAGSGASLQRVQTPNTSGTDDQGTLRLEPGQAMVVTGLTRLIADRDTRTLGEGISPGFGGSRKISTKREDFVIVVRATQF